MQHLARWNPNRLVGRGVISFKGNTFGVEVTQKEETCLVQKNVNSGKGGNRHRVLRVPGLDKNHCQVQMRSPRWDERGVPWKKKMMGIQFSRKIASNGTKDLHGFAHCLFLSLFMSFMNTVL